MKKEEIILAHGDLGKLAAFCGCSTKYAKQCLQGLYDTDKAIIVRQNAIKFFYGVKQRKPVRYDTKVPTLNTK